MEQARLLHPKNSRLKKVEKQDIICAGGKRLACFSGGQFHIIAFEGTGIYA